MSFAFSFSRSSRSRRLFFPVFIALLLLFLLFVPSLQFLSLSLLLFLFLRFLLRFHDAFAFFRRRSTPIVVFLLIRAVPVEIGRVSLRTAGAYSSRSRDRRRGSPLEEIVRVRVVVRRQQHSLSIRRRSKRVSSRRRVCMREKKSVRILARAHETRFAPKSPKETIFARRDEPRRDFVSDRAF